MTADAGAGGQDLHNPTQIQDPTTPPNPWDRYSRGNIQSQVYQYVGVPDDYTVFAGTTPAYMGAGYGMGGTPLSPQPVYAPPKYTYDMLMSFRGPGKDRQVYGWQIALRNAGYLGDTFTHGKFDQQTEEAMGHAMQDANVNGETLDGWFTNLSQGKGKKNPRGPSGGGGPRDITSTSISLTGRAGAQAVLTQALAEQLGREPSNEEVTRFMHSLNAEEKANPTVTHTHISAGGASQSSTTTQSDVDAAGEAVDWAKTNKATQGERQAYRDSTYFDILHQMLGGNG